MRPKLSLAPRVTTRLYAALLALIALFVPSLSLAAGGGDVEIKLSQSDMVYLYISLAFGVISLIIGFGLRSWVLKQPEGSQAMKDVGKSIHDGALAYLKKQGTTMFIFVVLLAVGVFFLYNRNFGGMVAGLTAGAFVAGVAASYFAGFLGMDVAVRANMRTAHAALSSFAKSLEIAFRSGAVAGLITVGIGLLGATLIFMFFGSDATKILVGFGFGGSLAALFMRVGGGIYTKAADVGADLVGKVEAGIPEDDPRNPATIADNVGDNVGDCAGMAADVFESYEVTLVAAIVLGAATAAIFDQATWTRLILFALMARGVGILASIIGIFMVKGNDDVNADPLKPISRGFKVSGLIAGVLTIGLAWYMMGGTGSVITTNQLVSQDETRLKDTLAVRQIRDEIAEEQGIKPDQVSTGAVSNDNRIKELYPTDMERQMAVAGALAATNDEIENPEKFEGFSRINLDDEGNAILEYATYGEADPEDQFAPPDYVSLSERYQGEDQQLVVYEIELTTPANPAVGQGEPQTQTIFYGPIGKAEADKLIADAQEQAEAANDGSKIEKKEAFEVALFANSDGELVAGIDDPEGKITAQNFSPAPLAFFDMTPDNIEAFEKALEEEQAALETDRQKITEEVDALNTQLEETEDEEAKAAIQTQISEKNSELLALSPIRQMPTPKEASIATIKSQPVEWWRFALCIIFGIIMAFIFEWLTDYYVALNKRPVQEVGQIAHTGPAPMIITGFAYGKESSVFSVAAIVVCLLAPLVIFNPAEFGGYLLSFYGIALVGLGLLTTTGYILAMDTFGPISDNAQGVFEMSGAGEENEEAAKGVQRLDAAGNTTKALTKGFAIATAVVAAVALFHAFVEEGQLTTVGMRLEVPEIFLGLLLGGAAPYLFSAFSINAVGRASFELINNVRQQFRNDPGIMKGTSKPDYGKCVEIVTAAAQRELMGPGILAIAFPIFVAFVFSIGKEPTIINGVAYNLVGAQALGGFLAGTILSGQLLAVMLANSGGLWDNSKKLIEDGLHGGKGTEAHKAAIVCDTVGDPFKDTAGPALNPLIKVMNLVALLVVPFVIIPLSTAVTATVTVLALIALIISIWWSKRGSMSSEMMAAEADAAEHDAAPAPASVEAKQEAVEAQPEAEKAEEGSDDDTPSAPFS